MGDFVPSNVTDLKTEDVETQVRMFFENNAPTYNAMSKLKKGEITEKGKRLPYYTRRPGGHTAYSPLASDFNAPVEPQTISMYVYPTYYALPMIVNETTIQMFQNTQGNNIENFLQILKQWPAAATKRINRMYHGDGSGALAFSSSNITSTGSATLNCTTTAAATPGQTKGAWFLEEGHTYQAWNTTTNAARGTFTVTTPGRSSCTINLLSGTISSGDPIVDVSSYAKYHRGLGHLIRSSSGLLQGLNTANYPDLLSVGLDLNGSALTPASIHSIKGSLNTRFNDETAETGMTCILTHGQFRVLAAQGYNFRQYIANADGGDVTKGVPNRYQDHDTVFIPDADADDDRLYFWKNGTLENYEQMPFGEKNLDGLQWRMLLGSNNSGSGRYQKAWGCSSNPAIVFPRGTAFIQRAYLTNVVTQVNV